MVIPVDAVQTCWIRFSFVRGALSLSWKSGPSTWPRIARYAVSAVTGQISSPAFPMKAESPYFSLSVLTLWDVSTIKMDHLSCQIAISWSVRWEDGSNAKGDGTISSPTWKKPMNAIVQTAHSMIVLGSAQSWGCTHLICWSMMGMIGSHDGPIDVADCFDFVLATPFVTSYSFSIIERWGSGKS